MPFNAAQLNYNMTLRHNKYVMFKYFIDHQAYHNANPKHTN